MADAYLGAVGMKMREARLDLLDAVDRSERERDEINGLIALAFRENLHEGALAGAAAEAMEACETARFHAREALAAMRGLREKREALAALAGARLLAAR